MITSCYHSSQIVSNLIQKGLAYTRPLTLHIIYNCFQYVSSKLGLICNDIRTAKRNRTIA